VDKLANVSFIVWCTSWRSAGSDSSLIIRCPNAKFIDNISYEMRKYRTSINVHSSMSNSAIVDIFSSMYNINYTAVNDSS